MASAQSSAVCPTQSTYTMTLTNTAYQTSVNGSSGYQSLYSEERRDLHLLKVRRETFVLYPQSNIPTADIAAAGFYYTGDDYVIRCYCCKLTVARLNNPDNPFTVHQSRAPNCPFVCKTVTVRESDQKEHRVHRIGLKAKLKKENERLRSEITCTKCKRTPVQTLFLPCRHLVACEECANSMDDCILCCEKILGTIRTFLI